MSEHSTLTTKVNPLMNLFLKRQAVQPLPDKKPTKKVKINQDKQTDPLYQILSWRDDIKPYSPPSPHSYRTYNEASICNANPENWGTNLQGIFINVDWTTTSMQSFKKMTFSNKVLSNGMIFVWGTKTNIGELLDHFEQMGYVYAENFIFVLLSRSKIPAKSQKQLAGNKSLFNFFGKPQEKENTNKSNLKVTQGLPTVDYQIGRVEDPASIFLNSESQYFGGSQRVLYMFRKVNKKQSLELRHQRTSDVYFTIGEAQKLDWKAKQVVYKMIQTLLINANYKQKQPLKLLEVWGQPEYNRKGWIMVNQTPETKSEGNEKPSAQ